LAKSLDDNWGCAGTDDKGKNFADGYDHAAFNAVASGSDIVNGLGQLNDLLQFISVNHVNGNTQASINADPSDTVRPPATTPHYDTPKFEGAYGGATDAPFGWGLITRWLQAQREPGQAAPSRRRLAYGRDRARGHGKGSAFSAGDGERAELRRSAADSDPS
jgi:hypothetical protein